MMSRNDRGARPLKITWKKLHPRPGYIKQRQQEQKEKKVAGGKSKAFRSQKKGQKKKKTNEAAGGGKPKKKGMKRAGNGERSSFQIRKGKRGTSHGKRGVGGGSGAYSKQKKRKSLYLPERSSNSRIDEPSRTGETGKNRGARSNK